MSNKRVYLVVFLIRLMYSAMQIIQKAALNGGMSAYVFVFYRQAFATAFMAPIAFILERKRAPPLSFTLGFKMFIFALCGLTATFITYVIALDYTSATLVSATTNSIPVVTFILAALLGMETVMLKRLSGITKVFGVALCVAGIATMAFFRGPQLRSMNHHHLLGHGSSLADRTGAAQHSSKKWALGNFLMIISNTTWSLWLVLQGNLLKDYPSKLLFNTLQCLFSAVQSFFVALAVERDFSRWKLSFDIGLLSVAYSGIIITGVSFYLQSWCIEKRGPVFLAMSTPLTLIITIACSSLILGESIDLGSILGGILMVGGLYSVLWGKNKEKMNNNMPLGQERKEFLENKEMVTSIAGMDTVERTFPQG